MAHDVFVSHSVKDKAVAEKIVARLEAESIRCWVAPRDVVPGADWGESIIDAIESSRIMVLIFSQNANGSTQIKREVERAVDKNVYTIPFRVEDIEPTKSLEYFISTSQWMDAFTPPLEQHLGKLAQTVKAILARPSAVAAGTSKPPESIRRDETPEQVRDSPPHSPVWLKPVAIVAGVLILGAAVWWYSFGQKARRLDEEKRNWPVDSRGLRIPTEVPNQRVKARPHPSAEMMKRSAEPVATPDRGVKETSPPLTNAEKMETVRPLPDSSAQDAFSAAAGISPTQNLAAESTPPNDDSRVIELKGKSPMRNDSGTITGYKLETLRFENTGSAEYRAEDPSAIVRRYYDSINRRDLTQACECLSKGFKAHSPMNKFAQIFASTQSIEVQQLQGNSRDNAKAVVTVSFVEVDAENRSREWERRVALVKEGDAWRIDGTQSTPR